jgi:hypothetical protein|tara:strand:- start:47 stop:682 length:636 start_codon:yes stop_codon:yes gene_type:complete
MSQLPTSGAINLNEIHVEAGGSSTSACTINDSDIRSLIGKSSEAQSDFADFYGAMAEEASTGTVAQTITINSYYQQYVTWGYRQQAFNFGTVMGTTNATTITGISGKTLLGITSGGFFGNTAAHLVVDGKMSNSNWSTLTITNCSGPAWNSSTNSFSRTAATFYQSQNANAPSGWTTNWSWTSPGYTTYQTLGFYNLAYSGAGPNNGIIFS